VESGLIGNGRESPGGAFGGEVDGGGKRITDQTERNQVNPENERRHKKRGGKQMGLGIRGGLSIKPRPLNGVHEFISGGYRTANLLERTRSRTNIDRLGDN